MRASKIVVFLKMEQKQPKGDQPKEVRETRQGSLWKRCSNQSCWVCLFCFLLNFFRVPSWYLWVLKGSQKENIVARSPSKRTPFGRRNPNSTSGAPRTWSLEFKTHQLDLESYSGTKMNSKPIIPLIYPLTATDLLPTCWLWLCQSPSITPALCGYFPDRLGPIQTTRKGHIHRLKARPRFRTPVLCLFSPS